MNKIGIFTYHDITNNGAFLQALSLQYFLKEKGYNAEIVNYQPLWFVIREYSKIFRPLMKGQISKASIAYKKRSCFKKSVKENMLLSKSSAYTFKGCIRLEKQYSTLITGSDEIWNTSGFLKYNPTYFLAFPPNLKQKRLSYAASMGQGNPNQKEKSAARKSLAQYSAILVRDSYTGKWVEDLLNNGKHTVKVVDPTLLYNINPVIPSEKNYLLITGMLSDAQIEIATKFAKEKGVQIISAGYSYSGHKMQVREVLSPLEWAGYVKNASYHFTSLFHGSIFSLKSQRPFAVLKNPEKGRKIEDLLDTFGLYDHVVHPNFTLDDLKKAMRAGYPDTHNDRLQELQQASAKALEMALCNEPV